MKSTVILEADRRVQRRTNDIEEAKHVTDRDRKQAKGHQGKHESTLIAFPKTRAAFLRIGQISRVSYNAAAPQSAPSRVECHRTPMATGGTIFKNAQIAFSLVSSIRLTAAGMTGLSATTSARLPVHRAVRIGLRFSRAVFLQNAA